MPISTLSVFMAGLISGYPVGASLSYELYHKGSISKKCGERLITFTNNPGPMFVISVIGIGMFASIRSGIVLYIIHIISIFVTAIILREKHIYSTTEQIAHKGDISISQIIENDFMKTIKICGFVTFFAILNDGLTAIFGIKSGGLISCITEITTGISNVSQVYSYYIAMPITSFSLGCSGLCVCMQVRAVTKYQLSLKKYIKFKLVHGAIAAAICSIYINYTTRNVSTIAINKQTFTNDILTNNLIIFTYIIIVIYSITRLRAKK